MAHELTATDNRAAMLNSMRPSKDQLESAALEKHRSLISFELERVSTKIDRFGWGQMSARMKDSLTEDWADVLDPYRLAEVKAACAELLGSKPRDATNEQQVKNVIVKNRSKALAKIPKQITPEPAPEQRAKFDSDAIIKAAGGGMKTGDKYYD